MKMNTLEKLYLALRDLSPAVELPEDLRRRAEAPLLRMLEPIPILTSAFSA